MLGQISTSPFPDLSIRPSRAAPRPRRDPQDETRRLVMREPDHLARINHFLFQGALDFRRGVRAATFGDGVGDSTLCLAEQLKPYGGSVSYIDADPAAAALAEERAKTRGLDNVTFHVMPLTEANPDLLGRFEYVSAFGALLRAEDPVATLAAARSLVRPGGGLMFAVNGAYGWLGTAMIRDLAAIVTKIAPDRLALERMLTALPGGCSTDHPLFNGGDPEVWLKSALEDPQDFIEDATRPHARTLTVPQIYALLGDLDLHLADFTHADLVDPVFSAFYHPDYYIRDPELREAMQGLSPADLQTMAELLHSRMRIHCLYASTRPDSVASVLRLDYTPFKMPAEGFTLANGVIEYRTPTGYAFEAPASLVGRALYDAIDGVRTVEEILAEARAALPWRTLDDEELGREWVQLYANFACFGGFLLRHQAIPPFETPVGATFDLPHGL